MNDTNIFNYVIPAAPIQMIEPRGLDALPVNCALKFTGIKSFYTHKDQTFQIDMSGRRSGRVAGYVLIYAKNVTGVQMQPIFKLISNI